ncbi:UNVERIFIED_CONTAM: putative arabinosyltransferase A [Sesamum radiatum]|uniref:Arabinosyltransferase A n=1 Tax=Sesamum radiatum TaxID=300843 RepID=A0AAW2K0F1_SESRA
MAGRHYFSSPKSHRSPLILFILSLIFLSLLFYIFTSSSSSSSSSPPLSAKIHALPNPNVDYSFVSSLEKFLTNSKSSSTVSRDTVRGVATEKDVKKLDDLISQVEDNLLYGNDDSFYSPIRVYVYDMPSKFTFDLLWLFHNSYKETSNLTSNGSPVHRLIEQEALKWVTDQPAWKRSGGRDHILPVHHPWSFKSVRKFMKNAIWLLPDMDSTGNWSIFCLSPAGDTPSSARLFDAIVSGCIPVIVSDELELPFEGILDYRKIAVFISSSDALQPGWLLSFLRSISPTQIKERQINLAKMAGKLVNIKLHVRRSQRVVKESRSVCTCECRRPNSTSPGPLP